MEDFRRIEEARPRLIDQEIFGKSTFPDNSLMRWEVIGGLMDAEECVEETTFLLSGIVNDIVEVDWENSKMVKSFPAYIESSMLVLHSFLISDVVEQADAEIGFIAEEHTKLTRAIKQTRDLIGDWERASLELADLDLKLEAATRENSERKAQAERLKLASSRAGQERKALEARLEEKRAVFAKPYAEHAKIAEEAEEVRVALSKLRTKRSDALDRLREAESSAAEMRARVKAKSKAVSPAVRGKTRFPCVVCEKEAAGVMRPCLHTMCLDCVRQAQEVSFRLSGTPFPYPVCPTCQESIDVIDFSTFEFHPVSGEERDKI
jgi:hypothetical protein